MNALIDELISALENCDADSYEIGDCLDEFADNHRRDVAISSGETRYAVVFKHDNFVLKIPRYGYCKEDYCQAEIRAYESAKAYVEDLVDQLLAVDKEQHTLTIEGCPSGDLGDDTGFTAAAAEDDTRRAISLTPCAPHFLHQLILIRAKRHYSAPPSWL